MDQKQREAYIKMREEEVYGGREPTLGVGRTVTTIESPRQREALVAVAKRKQEREKKEQRESTAQIVKVVLWMAAWIAMLCLCQVVAERLDPRNPTVLTVFLEMIGTVTMLLITFWRFVLGVVWLCIGLMITFAIIKGAYLIVFRL
jgi:hypothetical protein